MSSQLPEGWTIERVRALAGASAVLMPVEQIGSLPGPAVGPDNSTVLHPDLVISCGGPYIFRARGHWFLAFPKSDGTIFVYSNEGTDLEEALRSL